MGMYGTPRLKVDCREGGPSLTKQSFRDEVNINKIIARYEKTGMVEHLNKKAPFYGDVSGLVDYQSALNVVKEAEDLFMGMSAEIRSRFNNDPQLMIEFLSDARNKEEAIKLGIVNPDPSKKAPEKASEPSSAASASIPSKDGK